MKAFQRSKSATWNDPLLGYFHFTIEIDIKNDANRTEWGKSAFVQARLIETYSDYCFSTVNEITFFM